MRVPLSWLRELAPIPGAPGEIAEVLDGLGLVVERLEEPGKEVRGVVAARVLEVTAHPDADKLTLVDIEAGGASTRVVCGARNLAPGDLVPYAPPGAVLPGGFTLERRKIRGQVSEGMLCSARELGLGEDHSGILHLGDDVDLGSDVRSALGLDDAIFDLEVTPNRPDAMSVVGVARDLAAAFRVPVTIPGRSGPPAADGGGVPSVTVAVEAPARCPRYVARTAAVSMGAAPAWMARRLVQAGMRPISNVVDVTNYVLLERGQPLHAFDLGLLGGRGVLVRLATEGEGITTLDGVERALTVDDLLICDAEGAPQAIAGVMGGGDAEVGSATAEIFLESACFAPEGILRTSKRLGLRTESSVRFERGVDPNGVAAAAERACELMEEVASGRSDAAVVDVYPEPVERRSITVRTERVNAILGTSLSADEVVGYLEPLGIEMRGTTAQVPTSRPDIEREVDLVEEVARHHGYNRVARTQPSNAGQAGGLSSAQRDRRLVSDALVGAGLLEGMTSSLVAAADLERAGLVGEGIELENPLRAEESLLRPALLPGLLGAVAFNAGHGLADVGLFELGHVFLAPPEGQLLPDEREHLAVVLAGREATEPHAAPRPLDVHDAVGCWEVVAESLGLARARVTPAVFPGLHPARCGAVEVDGSAVGFVGEVAPEVLAAFDLVAPVVALEVDLGAILRAERRSSVHQAPSVFPAASFDLAFVVDERVSAGDVRATLEEAAGELLETLTLFDVFRGAGVGEGRKSLTFALRLRARERTLTDEELGAVRTRCIDAVAEGQGGVLRS